MRDFGSSFTDSNRTRVHSGFSYNMLKSLQHMGNFQPS